MKCPSISKPLPASERGLDFGGVQYAKVQPKPLNALDLGLDLWTVSRWTGCPGTEANETRDGDN